MSQEDAVSILSSIEERLSNRFAELEDDVLEVRRGGLTKAEVDELIGVLSFDRTGAMSPEDQIKTLTEVEIPFWKEKLNESEEGSVRSKQITGIIEMMEIKSDVLRIRNNQKPETDLVKKLIKEEAQTGDISRLRRFSKWAKENAFALSAVLISAVGILTTILIAGRGAIRSGARATKNFASVRAKIGAGVRCLTEPHRKRSKPRCQRTRLVCEQLLDFGFAPCLPCLRRTRKKTEKISLRASKKTKPKKGLVFP